MEIFRHPKETFLSKQKKLNKKTLVEMYREKSITLVADFNWGWFVVLYK